MTAENGDFLPCKARLTEFTDSKVSAKNDRHVKMRSSKNCLCIICLVVAPCKNSSISFLGTKTLFSTFPSESHHLTYKCNKIVSNSVSLSFHKSTNKGS